MTSDIITTLEREIDRYGDDLYRLALLLTPDEHHATAALADAVRQLIAAPPAELTESTCIAALIAALPPEHPHRFNRSTHVPVWTQPPFARPADVPLLAALARLPRQQRLALGLTLLLAFDTKEAAPFFHSNEAEVQQLSADGLRALAPHIDDPQPGLDAGQHWDNIDQQLHGMPNILQGLQETDIPEACRAARLAIVAGIINQPIDPAVRGHLALCSACRAIAQTWQYLENTVEHVLRNALRDIHLPADFAVHMLVLPDPQQSNPNQRLLRQLKSRRAIVLLLVIIFIAALVLPHPWTTKPSGSAANVASPSTPRDLVQRALTTLYTPPSGQGVWHGRWELYWRLSDGAFVPLVGEVWRDPTNKQQRVQLVHKDGGGPYEFMLTDGASTAWYAVTDRYGMSLYPTIFRPGNQRVQLEIDAAAQQHLIAARLDAGAWGLGAAYLRQAQAAPELRNWGHQRADDGSSLEVIGFDGFSPLGLPPDAPKTAPNKATIVLTINPANGMLYEVREIIGPTGGEQVGRTTWRFAGQEWVPNAAATGVFNLAQAWNGVGDFAKGAAADPALPLVATNRVSSLAHLVSIRQPIWLPSSAPNGTTIAALLDVNVQDQPPRSTVIYLGAGRRLTIQTHEDLTTPSPATADDVEQVTINNQTFFLHPGPAQGYAVTVVYPSPAPPFITEINAQGYTRAELIDLLGKFGPLTLTTYRNQAHLFLEPQAHDVAFLDALIGALADPPPLAKDAVQHTVERAYTRQGGSPDTLLDPYHRSLYDGKTSTVINETWMRGNAAASPFVEIVRIDHSVAGTVYERMYTGPSQNWSYNALLDRLEIYPHDAFSQDNLFITPGQMAALQMLGCSGGQLEQLSDGTRVIAQTEAHWGRDSCQHPYYSDLLSAQLSAEVSFADRGPYLADIAKQPITSWIYLDNNNHVTRTEVRSGDKRDGTLLESWELVSDEKVASQQVPANIFTSAPPQTKVTWDYTTETAASTGPPEPRTVSLTEALKLAQTPLFYLPPDPDTMLFKVEVGQLSSNFFFTDDPFEGALRDGLAVRCTYTIVTDQPRSTAATIVYQGPADQLRSYLRSWVRWRNSSPTHLTVDGRAVDGWKVTAPDWHSWTLVELDSTLLAMQTDTAAQENAITHLQRFNAP